MLKRRLFTIMVIMLLALTVSPSYAVPENDIEFYAKPFWQFGRSWTPGISGWECDKYAGTGVVAPCYNYDANGRGHFKSDTIGAKGCAITSLTMLYWYYGMQWMPDPILHRPLRWSFPVDLNPGQFDDWLVGHDSYNSANGIKWETAVEKFYYHDWPWGGQYEYLMPNYYCYDYESPYNMVKNFACYWAEWNATNSDPLVPTAEELLDNDLRNYRPGIMKIKWRKSATSPWRPSHFVMVTGYNPYIPYASYKVYDPGKYHERNSAYYPAPLAKLYGGGNYDYLRVMRFVDYNGGMSPMVSKLFIYIYSPVEVQIIDPKGRRTGYDPSTGAKLQENPMSLYYEDEPSSSIEEDEEPPSESYKVLTVVEPTEGNYIIKLFGTGDGPYTITMEGTRKDGTTNLSTSLTGTATPSLSETYRITYSPTGYASLSQTNQAPVANAGTNQTDEQSYEITLEGSASSDPDGDPLKYTWSFVSRPDGSTASLSDATAVSPTFTPDKPGTYTLQLAANDYFTDSAPSTGLSTNTNHTITVSGHAKDATGSQLDGDRDRLNLKMIFWDRPVYAASSNPPAMRL